MDDKTELDVLDEGASQEEFASALETTESKVRIGDDELSLAEAKELLEKGRDYTRKTQELADKEREWEGRENQLLERELLKLMEDPESGAQFLEQLQGHFQSVHGKQSAISSFELDDFATENEVLLKGALDQMAASVKSLPALERELKALKEAFVALQPDLVSMTAGRKAEAEVGLVESQLGLKVTPADIAAAKKATGIDHAVGAIAAHRMSDRSPRKRPPGTPKSEARTADVNTADAGSIFSALVAKQQEPVR